MSEVTQHELIFHSAGPHAPSMQETFGVCCQLGLEAQAGLSQSVFKAKASWVLPEEGVVNTCVQTSVQARASSCPQGGMPGSYETLCLTFKKLPDHFLE